MLLVKQHEVRDKDGKLIEVSRYDHKKELLYKQNRSHDIKSDINEYLTSLAGFTDKITSLEYSLKIYEVPINSKWPLK